MKTKLLKRLRKNYRILCEDHYITTKKGEKVIEKRYRAQYWGVANGYKGWHDSYTSWHSDMEQPLASIHSWIKRELREMISKEDIIWP